MARLRAIAGRVGLASAGIILGLATAEAGLRLVGFSFQPLGGLQFGWPDPVTLEHDFAADPNLLWVTPAYAASLAAARRQHPAVVFMGDSCTQFGTYPRLTADMLRARHPALGNTVKLAVAGWSSEQGRWQLERDILGLHPAVVTIYFGWNDHWIALGPADADIPSLRRFGVLTDHSRVAQALYRLELGLARRRRQGMLLRVSVKRYRTNLKAMVQMARRRGIAAVLITAPSNHRRGHEPAYLRERHLPDLDRLVPLHREYVEETRLAARDSGAVLCDAAAAFGRLAPPHDRYFQRDGIHLSRQGDEVLAELLAGCIERAARVTAPEIGDSGGRMPPAPASGLEVARR